MRWIVCVLVGCGRIAFDPIGAHTTDGGIDSNTDAMQSTANIVFVSSTTISPIQNFPDAYDGLCQLLASSHFTGTFVMWGSGPGAIAKNRIAGAHGFVRTDGLEIADAPTDFSSRMLRPVALDEDGVALAPGSIVMTGSDPTGVELGNCNGYSDPAGNIETGFADSTLDEFGSNTISPCGIGYHIYCFETDRSVAFTPQTPVGRRAFLSNPMTLGGGVGALDTACQGEAAGAGLTGTFLALVATQAGSAASRFGAVGPNWVRTDGVPIAATPAAFLAGTWQAPITTPAGGTPLRGADVFVGADDLVTVGTAADTCNSWTVTNATATFVGSSAAIPPRAFHIAGAAMCSNSNGVYCVEQ